MVCYVVVFIIWEKISNLPEVQQMQHIHKIIIQLFRRAVVIYALVPALRGAPELRSNDTSGSGLTSETKPKKTSKIIQQIR